MKRLILMLAAVALFAACNDDDHLFYGPNGPASTPQEALPMQANGYMEANYPDARIIEVDFENGVVEVDINDNGTFREVYFTADGEWIRTVTDIHPRNMPQVVSDAIAATEYAAWMVDDVDFVQSPEGEWYEVDMEQRGSEREVTLRIGTTGELLSVLAAGETTTDIPAHGVPQAVSDAIAATEYAAWIVDDIDLVKNAEGEFYIVELNERGTEREVTLKIAADGTLLATVTEIRPHDIPQVVLDAIAATEYAAWEIDDADFVWTPDGDYYSIQLEERGSDREVRLNIAADGTVIS